MKKEKIYIETILKLRKCKSMILFPFNYHCFKCDLFFIIIIYEIQVLTNKGKKGITFKTIHLCQNVIKMNKIKNE